MHGDDDDEEPPPEPPPDILGGIAGLSSFMDLDLDAYSWPVDLSAFVASPPLFFAASPSTPVAVSSGIGASSPLWIFEVEERGGEIAGSVAECNPRFVNGIAHNIDGKSKERSRSSHCQVDENSDESCLIKERMTQALRHFKDSTDQQVLVQVWAPVKNGNRIVLTTSGQPFVLDPQSTKLLHYRTVSLTYVFSADEDNDADLGLPGRVFKRRLPEWSPNVQYYSNKEYQRLSHALQYDVQGTLALPVFDPKGQSCICVVEMVMMSQKINYSHEVGKVCKALEAVNLKSSEILDYPIVQISNEGRQVALAEILEILTVVCETHKLPIAQTWVPCKYRTILAHGGGLKKICSSFDGSCMGQICMSTTDVAFYVIDAHMWGFREACVEHHLQKGQGVTGMAFASRRPCFSRDVTNFSKNEYPLVHYAKMFGLSGCLAICFQSNHSGDDDYILEFFFPSDCTSPSQQQALLYAILTLIRQCLGNLKVSTEINFHEGSSFELINLAAGGNEKPSRISSQSGEAHVDTSPETNTLEFHDDSTNEEDPTGDCREQHHTDIRLPNKHAEAVLPSTLLGSNVRKGPEKRRGKAEKTISLEVLQQYFRGSLKDAAKSLGVCPTTMKRICRQHGISRWPSRKINKVNRSLSKLKCVIESVQGGDGALKLSSLAYPLPVTVGSVPWPVIFDRPNDSKVAVREELALDEGQETKDQQSNSVNVQELILDQVVTQPEPDKCFPEPQTHSEGSMNAPTSQGSCQGSPVDGHFQVNQLASHDLEQHLNTECSLEFTSKNADDVNHLPGNIMITAHLNAQTLLDGNIVEDSSSSKDLKNLCSSTRVVSPEEHVIIPTDNNLQDMTLRDTETVTIKANYKEDIIRFRLPCNAGVVTLHDEIAKRLKLEAGTFDTKYLDDDHEWVMLSCDADLEECIEISRLSGAHVIRLSVQDIMPNLGSSCESSGD